MTLKPTLKGRCLCWQTTYYALDIWWIYWWLIVKCCEKSTGSIGGKYTCHWVSYEINAYASYLISYDEIKRDLLGYFTDISEATVLFNFTTVFISPYNYNVHHIRIYFEKCVCWSKASVIWIIHRQLTGQRYERSTIHLSQCELWNECLCIISPVVMNNAGNSDVIIITSYMKWQILNEYFILLENVWWEILQHVEKLYNNSWHAIASYPPNQTDPILWHFHLL